MNHPTRRIGWVSSKGSGRFEIDLRDHGRISSLDGVTFRGDRGKVLAEGILQAIETAVSRGEELERVVDRYRPRSTRKEIVGCYERWVSHLESLVPSGDRAPKTVREYRRIGKAEMPRWQHVQAGEITKAMIDDWNAELAKRGLSAKTRKNYLGALHACMRWLEDRGEIKATPAFTEIPQVERVPRVLPLEVVDLILERMPEERRGPYLVASRMGLRPQEVRALDVADVTRSKPHWKLSVTKAVKGPLSDSPIGPTKNRRNRFLPIHPDVRAWLEKHVDWTGRLKRKPLFLTPVSHKRLSHESMYDTWYRARKGIAESSLYEGTKHSMATDAYNNKHIELDRIRKFLGHSDPRSTEIYAKLDDSSLDVFVEG